MAADHDLATENAELRARVKQLETEIALLRADTAQTVATAQETLYWFERWGVDFNRVMATPQAELTRKGLRGLRVVYRYSLARYYVARYHAKRLISG